MCPERELKVQVLFNFNFIFKICGADGLVTPGEFISIITQNAVRHLRMYNKLSCVRTWKFVLMKDVMWVIWVTDLITGSGRGSAGLL